ncbi:MAG: hypothetical protein V4579_03965 [Pseudomonadota bacterium]
MPEVRAPSLISRFAASDNVTRFQFQRIGSGRPDALCNRLGQPELGAIERLVPGQIARRIGLKRAWRVATRSGATPTPFRQYLL